MRSIALLLLIASTASAQYNLDRCQPAVNAARSVTLAAKGESGAPLVIAGVVRDDRGAPIAGAFVRAFHADATGVYTELDDQRPRLCGVVRTDAAGRYRFVTIKPGPYPNTNEPGHVHFEVWTAGADAQRERLEFEGGSRFVRPLTRDADGTLRCERDFIVKRRVP